jgi:hypothetical protein
VINVVVSLRVCSNFVTSVFLYEGILIGDMTSRNLEITTVTVSTDLKEDLNDWKEERGCSTMHEALYDLHQEATK